MQVKRKQFLIGIIVVIAITLVSVWFHSSLSMPEFNVTALPKHAATLNEADIEKILAVENFRVFRRVHQVPVAIRESFSNFTEFPFDLLDPGEQISSDDLTSGKSSRRLVFLGLNDDSAVLVYEQGGFADACEALVFWYGDGGHGWAANVGCRARDITSLREVIRKRDFSTWKGIE
jgi:hypothetical protein